MTEHAKVWCPRGTDDFPVVATVMAVAACFGEALLQKYFAPGRIVQIALGLAEAAPVGLLVRYFVVRSRRPDRRRDRGADSVR